MLRICIDCVKEKTLVKLVELEGELGQCTACGENAVSLDTENNRLIQLVKALVRFYFSEWEYNHHWGGDYYESLFHGEDNIFFNEARTGDEELYEETISSIVGGEVYEEYDKGVSVFAGYIDGQPAGILRAIKSDISSELIELSHRLKRENYFVLEEELKIILNKYKGKIDRILKKDSVFYRARTGVEKHRNARNMGFEAETHYQPYRRGDISAPPPHSASAGRVNRAGVSFLYAASDQYTAVSEIRPHPGDIVSLGKFQLARDVLICDFSGSQLLHFFESDKVLDEFQMLNSINVFMNQTVPPSGKAHYSITQLIADCLRQMGYEGVLFNSTVGKGENIAVFSPELMEYVDDEAAVVSIKSVVYEYESATIMSDDEDYH